MIVQYYHNESLLSSLNEPELLSHSLITYSILHVEVFVKFISLDLLLVAYSHSDHSLYSVIYKIPRKILFFWGILYRCLVSLDGIPLVFLGLSNLPIYGFPE